MRTTKDDCPLPLDIARPRKTKSKIWRLVQKLEANAVGVSFKRKGKNYNNNDTATAATAVGTFVRHQNNEDEVARKPPKIEEEKNKNTHRGRTKKVSKWFDQVFRAIK